MFQDCKDLLSAFNDHNVKYLIVGGYAVSFHAQPRATKDLEEEIREAEASQTQHGQIKPPEAPKRGLEGD